MRQNQIERLQEISAIIAAALALQEERKRLVRTLYKEGLNVPQIIALLNENGKTVSRQAVYNMISDLSPN